MLGNFLSSAYMFQNYFFQNILCLPLAGNDHLCKILYLSETSVISARREFDKHEAFFTILVTLIFKQCLIMSCDFAAKICFNQEFLFI